VVIDQRKIHLVNELLLSQRAHLQADYPFYIWSVDQYVPKDFYSKLVASFPTDEYFVSKTGYHGKRALGTRHSAKVFSEYLDSHPDWNFFFGIFETEAFLRDLLRFIKLPLIKSRGLRAAKPYRRITETKPSYLARKFWHYYSYDFEFSRLDSSNGIDIHADSRNKIASIILHFQTCDWKSEYLGGTKFFQFENREAEKRWGNWKVNHVQPKEYDDFLGQTSLFHYAPYKGNALIMFLRSHNSFHTSDFIKAPRGLTRDSVIINVTYA